MRKLINLVEDESIKKEIVAAIKHIDDPALLKRVLRALKEGNIGERLRAVLGKDPSAARYINDIARIILSVEAPVEDVEKFLIAFPNGVINTKFLTDGKLHTFLELCNNDQFVAKVFKDLSVYTTQGIGPGELAIAILSPDVKHVGQSGGGGDIIVGSTPVEVKGSISGGGRWSDAKKAKMDMPGTARAIADALKKSNAKIEVPNYLGLDFWCEQIRPAINPRLLAPLCKKIADNLFSQTDTNDLAQELQVGNETTIKRVYVRTSFENYKTYAKFKGMILLDTNTEQLQYFETFDQMNGHISAGTPYLRAPERDVIPQVDLKPNAGAIQAGRFSINPKKEIGGPDDQALSASALKFAEKLADARMITDRSKIEAIALDIVSGLQSGMKKDELYQELLKQYPELNPVSRKATPAATTPAATTPATPPAATGMTMNAPVGVTPTGAGMPVADEPETATVGTRTPEPRTATGTVRERRA